MALSSGDLLVYDGTQWLNQPSTSNSFSVDSPTFYVDTVNHRVGIGTTNPVGHTPSRRTLILSDTSHDATFEVWGTLGGKAFLESVAGDTYMGNLTAGTGTGNLNFAYGNGSNGMIILGASGNVGVGTTSPGSRLHVAGPITVATIPKTGAYQMLDTDSIVFSDVSGGNANVTLPAASSSTIGRILTVYRINSTGGNVTVVGHGTDTVNGTAATTAQWQAIQIVGYTSTSWIARLL